MRLMVNGEPQELSDALTVAELIARLDLNGRRIAVEVNREILPRETYTGHVLAEGDEVEIVQFVGGG